MRIKIVIIVIITLIMLSCNDDKKNKSTIVVPKDPTLEQLNDLVNNSPNDEKILFERAKYFYKNDKYYKAITDMKNVLKIDSVNPVYYHSLADYYLDAAKSRYAIRTMEKVVSLYPERIPSLLKLSEFYFIVKQYDKSLNTINSILYFSPDNPEAYFMLGVNFKEMKQFVKAKNSFLTAVENNPEHIDAWLELGKLAEEQGDSMAVTYFNNALLIENDNLSVLHHLAYYHQNNGDFPKALEVYRKSIGVNPSFTSAYLNSGIIYLKLDSLKQAFDNFNIMVNMDKANPKAYYFRGLTHYMGHNNDAAKSDFEQAIKIYPEYPEAKQMLEKLKE